VLAVDLAFAPDQVGAQRIQRDQDEVEAPLQRTRLEQLRSPPESQGERSSRIGTEGRPDHRLEGELDPPPGEASEVDAFVVPDSRLLRGDRATEELVTFAGLVHRDQPELCGRRPGAHGDRREPDPEIEDGVLSDRHGAGQLAARGGRQLVGEGSDDHLLARLPDRDRLVDGERLLTAGHEEGLALEGLDVAAAPDPELDQVRSGERRQEQLEADATVRLDGAALIPERPRPDAADARAELAPDLAVEVSVHGRRDLLLEAFDRLEHGVGLRARGSNREQATEQDGATAP
jgi:hypothetical protein